MAQSDANPMSATAAHRVHGCPRVADGAATSSRAITAGTSWTNASGVPAPDNTDLRTVEVNYQSRAGFGVFGATARGANATNSAQTFTIQVLCLSN